MSLAGLPISFGGGGGGGRGRGEEMIAFATLERCGFYVLAWRV